MEYIRSLNEYDRRLMLGWKPKRDEKVVDQEIRAKLRQLTGKGRPRG